jgi:uncharacterized membrane protein YeiH
LSWEMLSIIGTIAFAVSGAIVAMEEEYDILGIYVLGMVTAFGGGVVRNLLIGEPVTTLWEQSALMKTALLAMTAVIVMPNGWILRWKSFESFFDAIGLSAFAIQGALYAVRLNVPISAVVVAAVMTGIGGGMIRDVLAGRKPLVLRDEIYAVWAMLAGLAVGMRWAETSLELSVLFVAVVVIRMLSVYYRWRLPRRSLRLEQGRSI